MEMDSTPVSNISTALPSNVQTALATIATFIDSVTGKADGSVLATPGLAGAVLKARSKFGELVPFLNGAA